MEKMRTVRTTAMPIRSIKIGDDLWRRMVRAAKREEVSVAEWLRQRAEEKLNGESASA